ncbi:hypothetical protein B0H19DRAFT_1074387 [Mycena capillaripes]|nr:hypothetical protein B0H19DRAFT_1074387 [Mycena capillaripes]
MSLALTSSSPHIQISALVSLLPDNGGRFHARVQAISETARVPAIGPAALTAALKEYEEGETTETDGENGNPSQSHPTLHDYAASRAMYRAPAAIIPDLVLQSL